MSILGIFIIGLVIGMLLGDFIWMTTKLNKSLFEIFGEKWRFKSKNFGLSPHQSRVLSELVTHFDNSVISIKIYPSGLLLVNSKVIEGIMVGDSPIDHSHKMDIIIKSINKQILNK